MNTSEVLYKAADLIEERGWGQGAASYSTIPGVNENTDGPLCIEGGIMAALGLTEVTGVLTTCPSYLAVKDYLASDPYWVTGIAGTFGWTRLYNWNDHPDRTATEVIEVLRACAVIEAAKENAETRQVVSA